MFIKIFKLLIFSFISFLFGQDYTIDAGNMYFNPSTLQICPGETVEWYNSGGYHDVNGMNNSITGESFNNPEDFYLDAVSGPASIGTFTFTIPGEYNYDCSIGNHAASGMIGTIIVNTQEDCGCTDPEAYNCTGSSEGNYVTDIGGIIYDFTCNGTTQAGLEDCSADQYCEGYYNPEATIDDGSCKYYQAPNNNDVSFIVRANGIFLDWSSFSPPLLLVQLSCVVRWSLEKLFGTHQACRHH